MHYPKPKKGTRFRIFGPRVINGMNIWIVIDIEKRRVVGPKCFSIEQAKKRVKDLLAGRKLIWLGYTQFTREPQS